jgi:hypothetical protein
MHCCRTDGDNAAPATPAPKPRTSAHWFRRVRGFFQWALPLTTLALVPKCPACVAAYVLLFTGIGLSHPAAAHLRTGLIAACITSLTLLAAAGLYRWVRRTRVNTAPDNGG